MVAHEQPHTIALSPKQQEHASDMKQAVETAVHQLAEQLQQGFTQDFLDLLAFYGKFHQYSIRNLVLIRCQRPDASRVAGYGAWKRLGRQVRKGAKAIYVWAPLTKKDDEGNEVCIGFKPTTVFDALDLTDIDTNPLPSLWTPLPDDCQPLYDRVVHRLNTQDILVLTATLPANIQGKTNGQVIILSKAIPDSRNRLATLLHELAHYLAHYGPAVEGKSNAQCELEAESASYVVLSHLGISYPFSRDYLLSFKATPDQLRVSLAAIQMIVRKILTLVESPPDPSPAAPHLAS